MITLSKSNQTTIDVILANATDGNTFTRKTAYHVSGSTGSSLSCAFDQQSQIYWIAMNGQRLISIGAFQADLKDVNSLNGIYPTPLCWNPKLRSLTTLQFPVFNAPENAVFNIDALSSSAKLQVLSTYILSSRPTSTSLGHVCTVDPSGMVYTGFKASSQTENWPSALYSFDVSSDQAVGKVISQTPITDIYGLTVSEASQLGGSAVVFSVSGQTSLDIHVMSGSNSTIIENILPGFGIRYLFSKSKSLQSVGFAPKSSPLYYTILIDQFSSNYVLLTVDLVQKSSRVVPLKLSTEELTIFGITTATF